MKKENKRWSIKDLQDHIDAIEFPEYQREPTVWNLDRKRKLIDSILRNFDIASIYLHKREDGNYDCIDGRQRINAIYSFLGLNEGKGDDFEDGYDNKFKFKSSDELLGEGKPLKDFDDTTWDELKESQKEKILDYELNIIEIHEVDSDEELNLMFLRLQLGAPLNGGEKLNAMRGDMRNFIYKGFKDKPSLSNHPYFESLNIPKKRYSSELTASQIAINFFSLNKEEKYHRARFVDLQEFFKDYQQFNNQDVYIAGLLYNRLDIVNKYIVKLNGLDLKNRAMGVSTFLFVNSLIDSEKENDIVKFIEFLAVFLTRLKKQVEKGIDIDKEYRDLLKFQTYISQAAVERYAIANRQKFLEEYFDFYLTNGKIKGDH